MSEWAFPFGDVNGDRAYSDADFAQFFTNLFTNGVFMPVGNGLGVKANLTSGMSVVVPTGAANVGGRQYLNTEDKVLTVPVAGSQIRTDSVVIQLDLNARTINAVYKSNTTQVVRNDTVYELQLATVTVPANASSISSANITDKRSNATVCGYSSPFEAVPVSGLEAQYQSMLDGVYATAEANTEANNSEQQTALSTMNSTFQTWLTGLQNQLTDNQATNLQGQINNLAGTNDAGVTITHDFGGYPNVSVFSWEYGLGLVGLGDEPDGDFGGTNVTSHPAKIEYLDGSSLKVYLPDDIIMTAPAITDQGNGCYLLTEGHRSVGIQVATDGYKNAI